MTQYQNHTQDKWLKTKRVLAVLVSICIWIASMSFSYQGWSFDSKDLWWLGWILAIAITVGELIFNTRINSLNATLFFSGILCYVYGCYTNVVGLFIARGGVPTMDYISAHPQELILPVIGGWELLLEFVY